ncbi:PIN domain-containing protein [Pseudomonas sp. C 49-2]|uniref:PIN domain-containing protein n=1 Tax=Pseudomonas sp. C 49-2 TaxID=2496849 RepID=UPI000F829E58|nr:type II toxin-antitoxin system VapC family toxin [Pseudomonas sp. C 49-2]RTX94338.1 PIN domain-containing protein [Pseudomonas sp. C 49-2]
MIGLDTNVLVRDVTQDDPVQSPKASELIESLTAFAPGFVSLVSVVELVWVLQSCYQSAKRDVVTVLETLLRTRELTIEHAEIIWQALRRFTASKADFADCLIERCGHAAGCQYTATFDLNATKTVGMQRLV